MDNLDGGTETRLARVRNGLKALLNTTNNINAGLMEYDNEIKILQPVAPITENRASLITDIDSLVEGGGTGTVPAMYEAALYLRGDRPIAHQCVDDPDADNPVCLTDAAGIHSYNSPMTSECQSNHIVVLTDGNPTKSNVSGYRDEPGANFFIPNTIKDELGITACIEPDVHEAGTCGEELATFLNANDNSDLPDLNNIVTHTIGFNFSETWLDDVATAGGGDNYEVSSTKALITAFEDILEIALEGENTFVAPAVTLDQFTRISHRNDMYLALFKPTGSTRWNGNLKKYLFKGTPPRIKDKNNNDALDDASNSFKETAHSLWSAEADGAEVTRGGAASLINSASRSVYTWLDNNPVDLTHQNNALHEDNDKITAAILNVPGDEVDNLLQWARGVDVDDEDENPATVSRHHMGDPLHSQPVVVNYGGTKAAPDSLVFVGTNEGYLHAIDAETGIEEYAFVPQHLLENLDTYYDNQPTLNRLYGMDGDLTLWVNDANNNGVISGDSEHAYLYAGMRRGGRQYYALDVTVKDKPEHLWTIEGGKTGFEELGQTWSKPTLAKIALDGDVKRVLIFAGGYDPMQDNTTIRSADTMGNSLFVVDAENGDLIWKPTIDTTGSDYSEMVYSIPSDPRVIDVDGDGLSDQIYVGDMGGQIWRFDISNTATAAAKLITGGMIASLSGNDSSNNRRFFYPPDVSLIATDDHSAKKFLSVAIGSGNRAHPLDETVDNRFYMIRQESIFTPPPGYGIADSDDADASYSAITELELFDATDNSIGSTDVSISGPAATDLAEKKGWLINLVSSGEKVLAQSITVDNKVMFTTYLPDSSHIDNCTPAAGSGRIYTVNVENATPVDGNTTGLRWEPLDRPGIPPQPSVIFPPDGGDLVVVVGPENVASPMVNLTQRVYWSEQPDF